MFATRIAEGLHLVCQKVAETEPKTTAAHIPTNHIVAIDRSGSMQGVLQTVCSDVKTQARRVPVGDTLTLLWFSGPGQKGTILKGVRIDGTEATYLAIDKAVDAHCRTVGSTCFSETFQDLKGHIKDLSGLAPRTALVFMTDGHPVVSNTAAEIAAIKQAITQAVGELSAVLLIGYSANYNRDLMTDMAERLNGSLMHNEEIAEFGLALGTFLDESTSSQRARKVGLEVPSPDIVLACSISAKGGRVTAHPLGSDPALILATPANGNTTVISTAADEVYMLARSVPAGATLVGDPIENEALVRGIYATAVVLVQRAQNDVALQVLNVLGDKAAMQKLMSSFTNAEVGAAEKSLMEAIEYPEKRLLGGRDTHFMPPDDAPCVVELLGMLMDDPDAKFLPRHPAFQYKKIGRTRPHAEGYPKFNAREDAAVPFTKFIWHNSKLNLSISAQIPGTIELHSVDGVEPAAIGLSSPFTTMIHRNYSIIKDGILNVAKLPVRCGYNSMRWCLQNKVIDDPNSPDGVYLLDLTKLPLINRGMAKAVTAKDLAREALEEMRLEAHLKVLRGKAKELDEQRETTSTQYTAAQEKFLAAHGVRVKDGSYSPPTITPTDEATDFYISRSFEIKIAKATLPSVADVLAKLKGKKALNMGGLFMAQVIDTADADVARVLDTTKRELARVRKAIQSAKFSMLLANRWLAGETSRDNCSVSLEEDIGGVPISTTVSFRLDQETVPID